MREKEGKPIAESRAPSPLLGLLATLSPLAEDFPVIEDHPPEPVDLGHHFSGPDHSRTAQTHRSG